MERETGAVADIALRLGTTALSRNGDGCCPHGWGFANNENGGCELVVQDRCPAVGWPLRQGFYQEREHGLV
jgi:hypothetical protein